MLRVSMNPTTNVAALQVIQARLHGVRSSGASQQIAHGTPPGRPRAGGPPVSVSAPPAAYQTYTSPSHIYQIAYPSSWRVYQEGSAGVTFAPDGGIGTVGGETEVVYGAIVNHYDPSGGGRQLRGGSGPVSLAEGTAGLLSALTQSSSYLRVAQQSALGTNARQAILRGTDPVTGVDERVTVVTRQLADQHLIYLLFITPERDAVRFNPAMFQMAGSLRVTDTGH